MNKAENMVGKMDRSQMDFFGTENERQRLENMSDEELDSEIRKKMVDLKNFDSHHLSPRVAAAVLRVLKEHPHYDTLYIDPKKKPNVNS